MTADDDAQQDQFCPFCDVTVALHDGSGTCDAAQAKARMLEAFDRIAGIR